MVNDRSFHLLSLNMKHQFFDIFYLFQKLLCQKQNLDTITAMKMHIWNLIPFFFFVLFSGDMQMRTVKVDVIVPIAKCPMHNALKWELLSVVMIIRLVSVVLIFISALKILYIVTNMDLIEKAQLKYKNHCLTGSIWWWPN